MPKLPALKPAAYAALLAPVLAGAYLWQLRTEGIFACTPAGYVADRYLGYCDSKRYGDYDHGAVWFGMEPGVQDAVRSAEVLFLGSSRMQFAFSTQATDRWFQAAGRRHYLLGFSHTENASFAGPLIERLKPHAGVYVVNVDRFFTDAQTGPGSQVLHEAGIAWRYRQKQAWQQVHRRLCGAIPALCGTTFGYFRSAGNGHWVMRGGHWQNPAPPTDLPDEKAADREHWQEFGAIARRFVAALPVPEECVLLTMVPYPGTRVGHARAMAEALGQELLIPQVDGLQTFDSSHLDSASAERWSQAFFELAGPRIQQCVADSSTFLTSSSTGERAP